MMINDDTVIIPGHGEIAKKPDLKAFHTMLGLLIMRTESAMKGANSLDDISVKEITKGYDSWGQAFISNERIVEIIYNSLSNN